MSKNFPFKGKIQGKQNKKKESDLRCSSQNLRQTHSTVQ